MKVINLQVATDSKQFQAELPNEVYLHGSYDIDRIIGPAPTMDAGRPRNPAEDEIIVYLNDLEYMDSEGDTIAHQNDDAEEEIKSLILGWV